MIVSIDVHNLNMVYEELKGDIAPFLKLYRLSKSKGTSVKQVVDALSIANNDLPAIKKRFKRLRNDVSMMQFRKRTDERNLYQSNNQIASTTKLLSSYSISCIRERRVIENLYNEKARIVNLVTQFKNNNEEYLKIKQSAEENVKSALNNPLRSVQSYCKDYINIIVCCQNSCFYSLTADHSFKS